MATVFRRPPSAPLLALLAWLFVCLGGPDQASAHRVNVHAYIEGDRLVGKGYFSNGSAARQSAVEVRDGADGLAGQAVTDDEGRFSLPLPQAAGPLRVVLKAGEGHQAAYSLKQDQSALPPGSSPAASAPGAFPAEASPGASASGADAAGPSPTTSTPGLSPAEVERIVDRTLAARLSPLTAQLAELSERQDRATLKDVFGGLGWIAGLFGVAAYFKRR